MIRRIKIKSFKSLVDFEIKDLGQFICLIGLNGTGKTTLLQFIDFVRAIILNRVEEWFEKHRWNPIDVISFGSGKRSVDFEIDVEDGTNVYTWAARFNILEMRCTFEKVTMKQPGKDNENVLLLFEDGKIKIGNRAPIDVAEFKWGATALCFLVQNTPVTHIIRTSRVFGILDPSAIAQPSQTKANRKRIEVEPSGKGLVGFVSQLPTSDQKKLFEELCSFYPSVKTYKIRKQTFGWKNLLMNELEKHYYDASHLSYGTLRILVFLSQFYSNNQCLFFDEIENGINQELVEKLVDKLLHFRKQIFVTTHSALVLNYLADEDAKKSVFFLYKDAEGNTKAQRFFEIPEIAKKLEFLGPGEAMEDTDLVELSRHLSKNH